MIDRLFAPACLARQCYCAGWRDRVGPITRHASSGQRSTPAWYPLSRHMHWHDNVVLSPPKGLNFAIYFLEQLLLTEILFSRRCYYVYLSVNFLAHRIWLIVYWWDQATLSVPVIIQASVTWSGPLPNIKILLKMVKKKAGHGSVPLATKGCVNVSTCHVQFCKCTIAKKNTA